MDPLSKLQMFLEIALTGADERRKPWSCIKDVMHVDLNPSIDVLLCS
jgi:hypothetical protein